MGRAALVAVGFVCRCNVLACRVWVAVAAREMTLVPQRGDQTGLNTVNVDGENVGWTPLRIRCLPRVLTVLA